jgi:hypothetical protein
MEGGENMKDYWLYQERECREPWAVHVYGFKDHLDFSFYAEYLPAKTEKFLDVPVTFEDLLDVFQEFHEEHGLEWTPSDHDQIIGFWETIKQDYLVLYGRKL